MGAVALIGPDSVLLFSPVLVPGVEVLESGVSALVPLDTVELGVEPGVTGSLVPLVDAALKDASAPPLLSDKYSDTIIKE